MKLKSFTSKELSLLGVMTSLVVVTQFIFGMMAMLFTAVPGLPNLIIGFFSSLFLYIALRKLPKIGSLTIMSTVYGLIFLLMSGRTFNFIGLLVGGLIGDLFAKFLGGYQKKWITICSLAIFRVTVSAISSILPVILGMTRSNVVVGYIIIGLFGSFLGTLLGGLFGDKVLSKLGKAGVVKLQQA